MLIRVGNNSNKDTRSLHKIWIKIAKARCIKGSSVIIAIHLSLSDVSIFLVRSGNRPIGFTASAESFCNQLFSARTLATVPFVPRNNTSILRNSFHDTSLSIL